MQRADVREIEPGLANLQLDPRLISGRHGSWNGVVQPGGYVACAIAAGGQLRVTAAADSTRIVLTRAAWVMVSWPMAVAVAAAQAGVTDSLKVAVQGAAG
eukprot:11975530-Alexandrium_andersonii.AAC.1